MNLELPFRIVEVETHSFDVQDAVGETVCSDLTYEDCQFIVKACNYFETPKYYEGKK